jgi:hypothetical protein
LQTTSIDGFEIEFGLMNGLFFTWGQEEEALVYGNHWKIIDVLFSSKRLAQINC